MTSFAPGRCVGEVRLSSINVTDELVSLFLFIPLGALSDLSEEAKVRDPAVIGQYPFVAPPPRRRAARKICL